MRITFNTAWPANLTDKAWQKKKSFLDKAKSKTKTGLGAELIKAAAAWGQIKFAALDATTAAGQLTNPVIFNKPEHYDAARQVAKNHTTVVLAAIKAIKAAAAKAATTKANKGLSTTAKAAADAIEKGLLHQITLIQKITLTDFNDKRDELALLTFSTNLAAIKRNVTKGQAFIKKVEQTPTRATFNDGIQDASRPLTVPLGTIGAGGGKNDPKALVTPLALWADGKDMLAATASPQDLTVALNKYRQALHAIEQWAS